MTIRVSSSQWGESMYSDEEVRAHPMYDTLSAYFPAMSDDHRMMTTREALQRSWEGQQSGPDVSVS